MSDPSMTHECSFLLRPSTHGVGVFAAHDIPAGAFLRLFGDLGSPKVVSMPGRIEEVPEIFRMYCIHREGGLIRPADFGCMEVGWYLNHSDSPNAHHQGYDFYALRDIMQGEEITIDYNSLEEPDHAKEPYYQR